MAAESKYEAVVNKLVELVENGTLKPNEKVYSENRLANLLGVQRSTVRDVYTALEILGILQGKQGEGTYFRGFEKEKNYKVLFLMMLLEQGSFEEIMQLRKVIEIGSAELCAVNHTKEDLVVLKDCLVRMENSSDFDTLSKEDALFHYTIAEATGNTLLKSMVQILSGYVNQITNDNWKIIISEHDIKTKETVIEHHRDIYEAIKNKKPYLARLIIQEHMDSVENNLKPHYRNINGQKHMNKLPERK